MDSSPDLSLKLRRGSSDSRDNFYMDFAQGIDSDIEEVDNSDMNRDILPPPPLPTTIAATTTTTASSSAIGVGGSALPPLSTTVGILLPPPPPVTTTSALIAEEVLMMCGGAAVGAGMAMPLPTLTETDDLPPTPPPMSLQEHSNSIDTNSPIISPTTSVLELIPPPPLSPTPNDIQDEGVAPAPATVAIASPPPEVVNAIEDAEIVAEIQQLVQSRAEESVDTEKRNSSEGEAARDGDDEQEDDEDEVNDEDDDDDDDDDKSTPPPPLPPLPSNLSYVQGGNGMLPSVGAPVSPPLTKSPSESPSPPITPPPCPQLSLAKIVSPPVSHVAQLPPLTPPSESDQSQPNSPPPLPQHGVQRIAVASPPLSGGTISSGAAELQRNLENALAAATSIEQELNGPQSGRHQQLIGDEYNRSLDNEDESTTITTPPSNGYSASSIIAPPPEHFAELDDDAAAGIMLANIPPPAGMEDDDEEQNADDVKGGDSGDIADDEYETEQLKLDERSASVKDASISEHSSPHASSIASGNGAARATGTGSVSATASPKGDSRTASRSVSRSGSVNAASRSGSVRGSIGSRAASVASAAAASVASAAGSAAGSAGSGVLSPQASIKSIKSPATSIKSKHSISERAMQSPQLAESAPAMPSPPLMRSPQQELTKSPPLRQMHSPPRVTTPPRVYSPPIVSSPPILIKTVQEPGVINESKDIATSTGADSLPTTTTAAVVTTSAETTSTAATATLSYQNEQQPQQQPTQPQSTHVVRPHLSSHHHYHLPHQFQHPHHQNHHTHSVRVPTPTVPVSYQFQHQHQHQHPTTQAQMQRQVTQPVVTQRTSNGGDSGGDSPEHDGRAFHAVPAPAAAASMLLASAQPAAAASAVSAVSSAPSKVMGGRVGSQHHVKIDEANLPHKNTDHPGSSTIITGGGGGDDGDDGDGGDGGDGSEPPSSPGSSSQQQLTNLDGERQTGHLALMYHSHQLTNYPVLPAIKRTHRPSFVYPPMPRVKAGDALATLFSALYGKLLVVMGVAFPMAEVISTYIPPSFYEVYYLYLYIGSMIFLFFMYATMLWGRPKIPKPITSPVKSTSKARSASASDTMDESDTDSNSVHHKHMPPVIPVRRPSLLSPLGRQHHYGSFYLRMGAVAFGIGSMIYSGLEFGQYFELNPDTKCHNVLLALTPATRMAFIFIQMYFIFLNNEQIKVYRYKIIARFGLMHMIGTNLAVWLNVLIQETKHEILTFYNPENRTLRISHRIPGHSRGHAVMAATDTTAHLRVPRGLKGPYQIFECRRTNIIGTLVQDASPFLFPCTIEYSLICAAILYVMWRSISRPQHPTPQRPDMISSPMKRSPHHYSVDCARAHKGLFVGILILVLTIISLILFFVLISRPDFVALAVTEVTICELLIYGTATIATLAGMIQIRHLQYDAYRSFSLDDILLVGAQTGSFLYNIFTVIAGHFTLRSDDMLVPINALASIVQTACQTMFILDASRRQAVSPEHIRKKPGREIVTFMLVVNLAMWAISTLEKSRAESHPIQLNFYGLWAWTIITHVSMPLAIFYRFHSTVCLCEIWKRAYKLKPTYM